MNNDLQPKKKYSRPKLSNHGKIKKITKGHDTMLSNDGVSGMGMI